VFNDSPLLWTESDIMLYSALAVIFHPGRTNIHRKVLFSIRTLTVT